MNLLIRFTTACSLGMAGWRRLSAQLTLITFFGSTAILVRYLHYASLTHVTALAKIVPSDSMDFTGFKEVLPNCVYAIHDYATLGFPNGGHYTATTEQDEFLRKSYNRKVQFMREHKVPVGLPNL